MAETTEIPAWALRLDAELTARGWGVPDLARALGRDEDGAFIESLHKYRNGKVANPRGNTLTAIAGVFGLTEADLRQGLPPHAAQSVRTAPEPGFTTIGAGAVLPRDVPVYGVTSGGPGIDFYLNGEVIDRVKRPPAIAEAKDAYALYVIGSSMYPRFSDGELIYVHPNRPPRVGDDVVIQLHARDEGDTVGPSYVKRLVRRSASKLTVEQFNPAGQLEFDMDDVKALHRIVPWNELLG